MLTRRLRSAASEESGVGLIELLIVMALMSVIGGVVMTSLVQGMKAMASAQVRFDALAELQKSVDRMSGPLRGSAPVVMTLSNAETAVVEVWDDNFVDKYRYTYTYCPAQSRIHMRRTATTVPYTAVNCATTTLPVLMGDVANTAAGVPVFRYRASDGVTPAVSAETVFQINISVLRALPNQPAIRVDTRVRLRNAG